MNDRGEERGDWDTKENPKTQPTEQSLLGQSLALSVEKKNRRSNQAKLVLGMTMTMVYPRV